MRCEHCKAPLHRLDDWVNGQPDSWDYQSVLYDNKVSVSYEAEHGWSLSWEKGVMWLGLAEQDHILAFKAAALFVELFTRGVSASFADKIVEGFIMWEEA